MSFRNRDGVPNVTLQSSNQQLFGFMDEDNIIGCVGVEINLSLCEIKHIAVSPKERGNGIGSKMINFLCEKYSFTSIVAETDTEAVEFYRISGLLYLFSYLKHNIF